VTEPRKKPKSPAKPTKSAKTPAPAELKPEDKPTVQPHVAATYLRRARPRTRSRT
jgi:hypothetical protein